ncbi:alpha-N-acetylglucosaminidase (NAGLU) [Achlya hypogyna]|uniref:Alpha-N-acetylglucosaminidase (NAGLU) n=1 Tax=Achlya hypogyna TaxID=1202772 RepID=A0A1V9ZA59_ACHHY|nr:alpha-N-acetylglucosaminidase (NAGLU) [Achlya hypogyna]
MRQGVQLDFPVHDALPAVKDLIRRTLGDAYITLATMATGPDGNDMAKVDMDDGKIRVSGSSATAMGYALHAYLKRELHMHVDWDGHALSLPPTLPPVHSPIVLKKASKVSYYLNVCTSSYSMWAWDWARWESHIDWMALNGINVPLAFAGQEKVWAETFRKFGVDGPGMDAFLAGAAFQAWGRMGNIQGSWGPYGPLPAHFIDDQFALQKRILRRMRELGMRPALPAFAGHVPAAMRALYPDAAMRQASQWAGFPEKYTCVYMLEPTDPLFFAIGKAFVATQREMYGDDGASSLYQTDMYNELLPHSADLEYLRASATAVIECMRAADPDAIWLMQSWLFYFMRTFWTTDRIQAYLGGVPNDRMVLLDLWSDEYPVWSRTDNYFGKSWIYCVLHTFGGNLGLHGNLPRLAAGPIAARDQSHGRMLGIGLTMEGIFQNYVVYELTLDMAWQAAPVDLTAWLPAYLRHRYHCTNADAGVAWKELLASVYGGRAPPRCILTYRPHWKMLSSAKPDTTDRVRAAYRAMLDAAADPALAATDTFRHDLVDVAREALSAALAAGYLEFRALYDTPTTPARLRAKADTLLELMADTDSLLATTPAFMLGPWLAAAAACAQPATQAYFGYQARNQLTRWGEGDTLSDYAAKQWSGLITDYYMPRWALWLNAAVAAFAAGKPMDEAAVGEAIGAFEERWQTSTTAFPVAPTGDAVEIARAMYAKYVA